MTPVMLVSSDDEQALYIDGQLVVYGDGQLDGFDVLSQLDGRHIRIGYGTLNPLWDMPYDNWPQTLSEFTAAAWLTHNPPRACEQCGQHHEPGSC